MNHKNVLKISDLKSNTDLVDPLSGYDLIFLNDFMIDANIGVYKHEKLKRQPLRINVIAKVKNPKTINPFSKFINEYYFNYTYSYRGDYIKILETTQHGKMLLKKL